MSDEPKLCGAKTRNGGTCKRRAGAGTEHLGYGRCANHTGSTPNGERSAAREAGREIASEMQLLSSTGVAIEPAEALLACVRMAWAEVQFFNLQIDRLELSDATVRPRQQAMGGKDAVVEDLQQREQLHLWIVERQRAMDRLARYSRLALDAGVAERQVRIAEQLGAQLGGILQRILGALSLTPEQQQLVPTIVRRELVAITQQAA